ncbi:modifier of mdg4-like [Contarinia nasturtii]|uniref:modifier of mdg4-like n=1 Tax=Contarinia nasturtii TaxID=265458 RepID=UPI0012D3E896|nr:modifier of mdg4-like [Contarinia nasturtii]
MEYGANEQYSLRWKHFNENISSGLYQSQRQGDFVDITLAVEGHTMQVHRLVMSVCSPYFQKMLTIMPANYHPFVLLKDVSYGVLEKLIEFIYNGEVTVDKEILAEFMSTGEALQIKGLVDNDDWQRHVDTSTKNVQKQQSSTVQQQQQQNANIMRNSASQLTRSPMTSNQTFIPTRAAPTSRNVDQLQHCRALQQRNADLMAKHASYLAQSTKCEQFELTNKYKTDGTTILKTCAWF